MTREDAVAINGVVLSAIGAGHLLGDAESFLEPVREYCELLVRSACRVLPAGLTIAEMDRSIKSPEGFNNVMARLKGVN